MPRKSRTEAGQRIEYLRWLWWETVRRHPEYRKDVGHLLAVLRQETVRRRGLRVRLSGRSFTPALPANTDISGSPDPQRSVAQGLEHGAANCSVPEPSLLFASATSFRSPQDTLRRLSSVHAVLNLYRAMLHAARQKETADVSIEYLKRQKVELPELAAFEAKWGLRIPVPPGSQRVPQRCMCAPTTHPVRIVTDAPPILILDIWRPAGMTVLDHVAGVLDHYQAHREVGLPPRWSLQQIDAAVRQQFGLSAGKPEFTVEVTEYRNGLAREAGYPSYVNLQNQARHLPQQAAAEEETAVTRDETEAMNLLRKPGIPPRQARKSGVPGEIRIREQPDDWLRLILTRPAAVDLETLKMTLKAHLTKGPLTIRVDDKPVHRRIFTVQDLARHGFTAPQTVKRLGLEDSNFGGRERVAELKKAYGDLVRRLCLPALRRRR